jgi:hypothetical protein
MKKLLNRLRKSDKATDAPAETPRASDPFERRLQRLAETAAAPVKPARPTAPVFRNLSERRAG